MNKNSVTIPHKAKTQSIGLKFAALLSLILIIAMTATSYVVIRSQKNLLDKHLNEKAEMLGSFVALISPEAILTYDFSSLNVFMKEAAKEQDIAISLMFDSNGNTLTNYLDWDSPLIRAAAPANGSKDIDAVVSNLQKEKLIKFLEFPISFEGKDLGKLVVGVNQERLVKEISIVQQNLIIGSVILIISLAIFIFLTFRLYVLRPVESLMSASRRVASGNLEEQVTIHAQDELGSLATSFNQMMLNRKEVEEELRSLRNMLANIINSMPSVLISVDQNGKVTQWNHEAAKVTGISHDQAVSQQLEAVFPKIEQEIKKVAEAIQSRQAQEVKRVASQVEGEPHFEDITIFPLVANGVSGAVIRVDDVTEHVRAENEKTQLQDKLKQAQKMESIGTLAGGVAHDFNNILTPILGFAQMAKLKLPNDSPITRHLDAILKASVRAQELVKQILTFSRRTSQERRPVDIRLILKESLKLLRSSIPTTIEIRQQVEDSKNIILADPTEIHQVIMNLCTNAYHAMRDTGGVLSVKLERVELTSRDASYGSLKLSSGSYLNMEISDNGPGMNPTTLDRIFEPYFTTKKVGEGTGMGLAVTHGIVNNHGGRISVYSEPGQGTTFRVFFPVIDQHAAEEEQHIDETAPGGSESILLVDDESDIVHFEQQMLEELGYSVQAFTNSKQALEDFSHNNSNYDLVITDMTMPGLTGVELAEKLLEARPEIPIILCTGFSELITEEEAKKMGIKEYVTKPIIRSQFAQTIRRILDQ